MRIRGDIVLAREGPDAAHPIYERALQEAHLTGARTFALAASVGLASTYIVRGQRDAAVATLRPALEAMPEGQDLSFARRARKLLDQLNAAS
jgi:predicted negative regulator of RcsB-dependent stress response